MNHLILILILVGRWQSAIQKNSIATFSFVLALILTVVGLLLKTIDFSFIAFVIVFFISISLLMQIFKYSTNHKYFWFVLPLIIGLGSFVSYLLKAYGSQEYFIWYMVLTIASLFLGLNKNFAKTEDLLKVMYDGNDLRKASESNSKTKKYWILSSILFILSVVVIYFL